MTKLGTLSNSVLDSLCFSMNGPGLVMVFTTKTFAISGIRATSCWIIENQSFGLNYMIFCVAFSYLTIPSFGIAKFENNLDCSYG